jgi:hypothetical protein
VVDISVNVTLEDLKNRQRRFDQMCDELYQKAKEKYPDIDSVIPIVLDPINGVVLKKGSIPKPVQLDQDTINAIRLKSLKHIARDDETCIECEVKYDAYGYVVAVIHKYMNDNDATVTLPDGRQVAVEGLRTKVARGRVKIINDFKVEVMD